MSRLSSVKFGLADNKKPKIKMKIEQGAWVHLLFTLMHMQLPEYTYFYKGGQAGKDK